MKDIIYRQAALDAIDNYLPADPMLNDYTEGLTCGLALAAGCIEQLPSAQPEHKAGKWIERNPQNSPDCRLIECSECGNAYIAGYNIDYDEWIDGRNFCMKCGANLRGGNNGKST